MAEYGPREYKIERLTLDKVNEHVNELEERVARLEALITPADTELDDDGLQ